MTDQNQTQTTHSPRHVAYHVRESALSKGFWNRVGVAWTNKDGGFTIQLDSLPLDGRIVCQLADKKTAE
jgi:hypothetical protein